MADPVEVARIRAYLAQHLTQYHWEALRDKLIREGHDPEAVERALSEIDAVRTATTAAQTARARVAALAPALTLVNLVLFGCFMPSVSVPVALGHATSERVTKVLWWGLAPILAGQVITIGVLFARRSALARPLLSALLPSLALALLLFGGCVVAFR